MKRAGLTMREFVGMFPDERTVEEWFAQARWGDTIRCPDCGCDRVSLSAHKGMRWRCRGCWGFFSVKKGTVMENSNLPVSMWVTAIYQMVTNLKGVSSTKIARDLGITQKSAWHMMHRLREAFNLGEQKLLAGTAEADETYMGGREANKHQHKRRHLGRGTAGKTAIAGIAERGGRVVAQPISSTKTEILEGFVTDHVQEGSTIYTDEHAGYR